MEIKAKFVIEEGFIKTSIGWRKPGTKLRAAEAEKLSTEVGHKAEASCKKNIVKPKLNSSKTAFKDAKAEAKANNF